MVAASQASSARHDEADRAAWSVPNPVAHTTVRGSTAVPPAKRTVAPFRGNRAAVERDPPPARRARARAHERLAPAHPPAEPRVAGLVHQWMEARVAAADDQHRAVRGHRAGAPVPGALELVDGGVQGARERGHAWDLERADRLT